MSTDNNCIFCGNKCGTYQTPKHHQLNTYSCDYCGEYILHRDFPLSDWFRESRASDKFKIACILNERRLKKLGGIALSYQTEKMDEVCGFPLVFVADILNEFPKKPSDFLDRAVLNLSRLPKQQPFEATKLDLATNRDGLHLFIQDQQGCQAFLVELAEQGYIRFNKTPTGRIQFNVFFLTAKFWEIINNLQRTILSNKNAFVAMWFDKSMDDVFGNSIKAIENDIGFKMFRVDKIQFNDEKICDKIISKIRESRFLVADVTGQRQAVYFEAGYAMGMGLPVIWTCKKTNSKKCCFDTRQYPHIFWEDVEDLKVRLRNRVLATIGKGNYSTP